MAADRDPKAGTPAQDAHKGRISRDDFEQVVTDILFALDDWTDLPDGPSVDDAREAVMRELVAYAGNFTHERDRYRGALWQAEQDMAVAAYDLHNGAHPGEMADYLAKRCEKAREALGDA